MQEGDRKRRVTYRQLDLLYKYLNENKEVANGFNKTTEARDVSRRLWEKLEKKLNNCEDGAIKDSKSWSKYWVDYKSKLNRRIAAIRKAQANPGIADLTECGTLNELEMKFIELIEDPGTNPKLNNFFDDENQPPAKLSKRDNFTIVRRCCLSLVRDHGRPVSMFDDQPFKDIINLVPLSTSEKQRITSDYIQKIIDSDQDIDDDTDMDMTADQTADFQDDDDTPLQQVKGEIEIVSCTCTKDGDEIPESHEPSCPAAAAPPLQTYWNYFEVSMDEATCTLCRKTISWTTIAKLKEHLQKHHPTINFLDDDEEFEKGPPSSVGSREELEQVYLEDNPFDENIIKGSAKKRKKAKLQLLGERPITRENIASSLDRFKSLDSFGNYVASLMKLIPKDKCIKFQIQIVERLLQEQAAAA